MISPCRWLNCALDVANIVWFEDCGKRNFKRRRGQFTYAFFYVECVNPLKPVSLQWKEASKFERARVENAQRSVLHRTSICCSLMGVYVGESGFAPWALVFDYLSPLIQPLIPSSLTDIVTGSGSWVLYLPFSSRYSIVGFRGNSP